MTLCVGFHDLSVIPLVRAQLNRMCIVENVHLNAPCKERFCIVNLLYLELDFEFYDNLTILFLLFQKQLERWSTKEVNFIKIICSMTIQLIDICYRG